MLCWHYKKMMATDGLHVPHARHTVATLIAQSAPDDANWATLRTLWLYRPIINFHRLW